MLFRLYRVFNPLPKPEIVCEGTYEHCRNHIPVEAQENELYWITSISDQNGDSVVAVAMFIPTMKYIHVSKI